MLYTDLVYVYRKSLLKLIYVKRLCTCTRRYNVYVNGCANLYLDACVYAYVDVCNSACFETPKRRNINNTKYKCMHVYVYVLEFAA